MLLYGGVYYGCFFKKTPGWRLSCPAAAQRSRCCTWPPFPEYPPEGVRDALLRYGDLAPVIYMLLFAVLPAFFFPVAVLAFAGGLLFGLLWGSVYTFIGAVINCALMFFLARRIGREKIRALVQRKLPSVWQARLKKAGGRKGFLLLIILRLIPAVPITLLIMPLALRKCLLPRICWAPP